MENLKIANKVLDKIKKFGYKPINVSHQNSYFIFEMGENAVTTFLIKGLWGWRFGLWIGDSDDAYIQLFAQHNDNIDKFKPSRSTFVAEFSKDQCDDLFNKTYLDYELKNMIGMIKNHPLIAYNYDSIEYIGYYSKSFILGYINNKIYIYNKKLKRSSNDLLTSLYNKVKIMLCKHNNIIKNIQLVDRNKNGWISFPRFELNIQFKDDATSESEIKFLNRWFKKERYKNLSFKYGKNGEYYEYT